MSENKRYLMSLHANWADEIDFYSLAVIQQRDVDLLHNESLDWPMDVYFGTNEGGRIHKGDFSISDIPEGFDANALYKLVSDSRVDQMCYMVLEYAGERISEIESERFIERYTEKFKQLVRKHGLEVLTTMVPAVAQKKRYESIKYDFTEESRKARSEAYDEFSVEWVAYQVEWDLDEVRGHSEHGSYAMYTYNVIAEIVQDMYKKALSDRDDHKESVKHSRMYKYMFSNMMKDTGVEIEPDPADRELDTDMIAEYVALVEGQSEKTDVQ